jgi:beta-glucosidase
LTLEKSTISAGESLGLSVTVSNTGERSAAEVVQFYLTDLEALTIVPLYHLVGFERVILQPGEKRTLRFTLTPEMMSFFDDVGKSKLEAGAFRLEVGGCSPGERGLGLGAPTPVTSVFHVI